MSMGNIYSGKLPKVTCVDCGWEWIGRDDAEWIPSRCEACGETDLDYSEVV